MEDIAALQKKFMELQNNKSSFKLSERTVVDIIQKILDRNKIKIIFSNNGKDFVTEEKISKEKGKILNEFMNKGDLSRAAEDRANAIWRPVIVASTVSEKAKLPKVGILYHKDIYDFLSQISHQNFEVASIHANRFDDEKFLVIDQDTKITYIRFMDYIVSEFIQCVDHDIGVNWLI